MAATKVDPARLAAAAEALRAVAPAGLTPRVERGEAQKMVREEGAEATPVRTGPSLKTRALRYLAAREHSRLELTRKLQPHVQDPDELQQVLDDLARKDLLSETRLAQAVVRTGATRYGDARLKANLRGKGLDAEQISEALGGLEGSELQRARGVWLKKFGEVAPDAKTRAKQVRFLASRGFSQATILRVVKGSDDDLGGDF